MIKEHINSLRNYLYIFLLLLVSACGSGSSTPRGDIWSGYYALGLNPGDIQFIIDGIFIREIYYDGNPSNSKGYVVYFDDAFGLYKIEEGIEGSGVIFLNNEENAGILFGTYPLFLTVVQETSDNIAIDFIHEDILINFEGTTKVN